MSLSPWDLSGNISFDFSLYRPRRPSYVFATQVARRRNESYRHATKSDSSGTGEPGIEEDFIEGIVKKKRKDSYRQATEEDEINIEMGPIDAPDSNHIGPIAEVPNEDACSTVSYHVPVHRQMPEKKKRRGFGMQGVRLGRDIDTSVGTTRYSPTRTQEGSFLNTPGGDIARIL